MRYLFAVMIAASVLPCLDTLADLAGKPEDVRECVKVEKGADGDIITITGRILSRHDRFKKGKSVRKYLIVTSDMRKIALPRSYVEHRDGTISGIVLRPMRGKTVELVCKGKVKDDGKKLSKVTVKKIVSVRVLEAGGK